MYPPGPPAIVIQIRSPRPPLPRWKRCLVRLVGHPVALDYVRTLVRYRPFDETLDLDPAAKGYLADLITSSRLFIPAASSLNDPWEAAPSLVHAFRWRDINLEVANFLAFMAPQEASKPGQFEALLHHLRSSDSRTVLAETQQSLMDRFRTTPVLSLSERGDNFLMWAYYGRGHNGYALVFDTSFLPFAGAVRVRYTRRRPHIYLNRRHMPSIVIDVLATKARQWEHEREWRVIVPDHDPGKVGVGDFAPVSQAGYYGTVPRESLIGIIIGDQLFRGPHNERVLDLIAKQGPHLRIWWAEIEREFRIALRPIRRANDDGLLR